MLHVIMEGKNTGNGSKCSVKNCPNRFYSSSRTSEKIRYFRFPNPKDFDRVCQDYAQSTDSLDSGKLFCHFKGDTDKYGSRKGTFGKLLMPEDSFVDYVSMMEKILMENIKSVATGKTGEQLYEKLKEIPFVHPCGEFPYVYLLQLFIRMRIFYIAKYANRNFKSGETNNRRVKKLRKLQILQHK